MCTDVDRNDKARVCVPGSVRVLGRRQIEMYSRLIHTVDHVEGYLREGCVRSLCLARKRRVFGWWPFRRCARASRAPSRSSQNQRGTRRARRRLL